MRSSSIKKQPQSSIGMLRLALVLVGIIAGCYISINAAIAENFKTANPSRAASVWPKNGFALSAVADEKLNEAAAAAAEAGKSSFIAGDSVKLQGIGNIALQSFKAEPINAPALRSLAFAAEAKGDLVRAKQLMAHAIKFSRRDTAANNWQLQKALKAQDLPASMKLLDRILREDDSLYLSYLPVLIAGVSQPEGMNAIFPLLLKQPLWEQQFWSMATVQTNISPELAVLRQKLLVQRRQKIPMMPFLDADVNLIQNLIRSGQFDSAKSLHDFLAGENSVTTKSKGDVKPIAGFQAFGSPFDWQIESKGEIQAYFNDKSDKLNLEIGANSIGVFARKLVKSETGRFNLKILTKPLSGIQFSSRFKCNELDKQNIVVNQNLNSEYSSFEKMNASDCNWFTLEILVQNKRSDTAALNIAEIELSAV
jgi:hypothetical protein